LQIISFIKKLNIPYSKILYIGSAVVSLKLFLLLVPYLLNKNEYFSFNQVYYSAGIITIFGRLGFDIIISKYNISLLKLSFVVAFNICVGLLFAFLFEWQIQGFVDFFVVVLYSFFYVMANIYLFAGLFQQNHKRYFYEKFLYGMVLLIGLITFHFLSINVIYVLPLASIVWFLVCFKKPENAKEVTIKKFYNKGISAFIVNTLPGVPIILDKFIINNFFDVETANAYTFAWVLTAPILYIGTTMEHIIYSSSANLNTKKLKHGMVISVLVNLILTSLILFTLYVFPSVLPKSVNNILLFKIVVIIAGGYSILVSIQNPLKAYILKYGTEELNHILAKVFPFITLSLLALLYGVFVYLKCADYVLLISIHFLFMTLITLTQYLAIKKFDNSQFLGKI